MEPDEINKVNESAPSYNENRVRIFHSFEEAEEMEIAHVLNQKPLDRVKETVDLILRVHGITRLQLRKRLMKSPLNYIRH